MLEVLTIATAGGFFWWQINKFQASHTAKSPRVAKKLKRLWDYAEESLKAKKFSTAEKALLSILKIDHKNTLAYNRLGVLYARQKNFEDAIECFEIASSLTPTVASLYNLGLVYYEKGEYQQAANSFERVVDLEPTGTRYVAFAKALDKLEQRKRAIAALEKASELEPNKQHAKILAETYERYENFEEAERARELMQSFKKLKEKTENIGKSKNN